MLSKLHILLSLLFGVLFISPPFNAFARSYRLTGKIKGINEGWVFVMHRQTGKIDSGRISKGTFLVSGNVTDPEFCNFGLLANGVKDYYFGFFLEQGNLTLNAQKDSLNDRSIFFSGSKVEEEFQHFQKQVNRIDQMHYTNVQAAAKLEELARGHSLKHPNSYVSAFALISYENVLPELSALYNGLTSKIQQSYYGELIHNKIMHH
ncbi:MAG: thiol:disulfide interchange protein [Mucilaginibacter sp.]|nr:thiol:disulfide interchange protein [Mucilaginibacter sp.]